MFGESTLALSIFPAGHTFQWLATASPYAIGFGLLMLMVGLLCLAIGLVLRHRHRPFIVSGMMLLVLGFIGVYVFPAAANRLHWKEQWIDALTPTPLLVTGFGGLSDTRYYLLIQRLKRINPSGLSHTLSTPPYSIITNHLTRRSKTVVLDPSVRDQHHRNASAWLAVVARHGDNDAMNALILSLNGVNVNNLLATIEALRTVYDMVYTAESRLCEIYLEEYVAANELSSRVMDLMENMGPRIRPGILQTIDQRPPSLAALALLVDMRRWCGPNEYIAMAIDRQRVLGDEQIAHDAITGLMRFGVQAMPFLVDAMGDHRPDVRRQAIATILMLYVEPPVDGMLVLQPSWRSMVPAVDVITQLAENDPDHATQVTAAIALTLIADAKARNENHPH
jgi:hypothetical protein